MWPAVWGAVSNKMVKEDLSKRKHDGVRSTHHADEAHDSNQRESWRKTLSTGFHCVSTICP